MGTGRCEACATLKEMKDLKRCANCQVVMYCSRECQKAHWKVYHKTACSIQASARQKESPKEKASSKKMLRWMHAWTPTIMLSLPMALDLANHEWGRHETHCFVMRMEYTGIAVDCQSFRVKDAYIEETANVLNAFRAYPDAAINLTDTTLPRLRCYLFFKEEDQAPNKPDCMRPLGGCVPSLQMWYNMDKEYSRLSSMRAIPELMNEINIRRDPPMAEERFKDIIMEPYVSEAFMDVATTGNCELFEKHLDRLRGWTNGGPGT